MREGGRGGREGGREGERDTNGMICLFHLQELYKFCYDAVLKHVESLNEQQ